MKSKTKSKKVKSTEIKSTEMKSTEIITKSPSLFTYFLQHIYSLNSNKYFAGLIMLIMNIGSKYITLELSKSQEDYIKYALGRQILVFSILWMGTRDIIIALVLSCLFILFADYLFNDNSKYCIINNKCINDNNDNITHKDINDAIYLLKKARKLKNKNKSQLNDKYIQKELIKENFI